MNTTANDDEKVTEDMEKRKEGKKLFIKTKKLMLDYADILYIESRAKKVEIHTVDEKESIEIYATMEELEGQLGEGFYRCHRAYIVNMAHITEYSRDTITLTNGDQVYSAKKKYRKFEKAYKCYLENGGVSGV